MKEKRFVWFVDKGKVRRTMDERRRANARGVDDIATGWRRSRARARRARSDVDAVAARRARASGERPRNRWQKIDPEKERYVHGGSALTAIREVFVMGHGIFVMG